MHTSEKTHRQMLPQSDALELVPADNPGVGTKRGTSAREQSRATGVQHGQGETAGGYSCPPRRHPNGKASADPMGERGLATPPAPAAAAPAVPVAERVLVVDRHGHPLMPCHPARARKLLRSGRARVRYLAPLVIRLVDREVQHSEVPGVELGVDPGSVKTGVSVFCVDEEGARHGLISFELEHRGQLIRKKMGQRAGYRRRRRSVNLRYRKPRFENRTKPKGGLAATNHHRVDNTMSMVTRLCRWAPVARVHQELVRFDTQQMENPEVSGVEYQQGTLAGFEVREYLLEKWERKCAYCGAEGVPLNLDHITPKSKGGTNRVSNLTLACVPCNQEKDDLELTAWLEKRFGPDAPAIAKRVLATAKAPLKDAAAVNSTRWALHQALKSTGLPVTTGSGGKTKWNRTRFGLSKSHVLDALCVGDTPGVVSYPEGVTMAKATGRGTYARTRPDAYGFPRLYLPRTKVHHGFATGDLVRAVVPKGKYQGTHVGRIAVRARGTFSLSSPAGKFTVSHRHCTVLQRADGWSWSRRLEEVPCTT